MRSAAVSKTMVVEAMVVGTRAAGTRAGETCTPPRAAWPVALGSAALLLVCAGAAVAIRRVVASEILSDGASLALTAATGCAIGLGALGTLRVCLRRGAGRQRRPAAVVLCLGFLGIGAGFAAASLPDASVEMEAIVEARGPQTPPATVELGPKGDDVRLTGELKEGVAKRLAALLATHPLVTRIHLTSEGGLADEGQALGNVIAAHGLVTFVPDYCVSACTLAFVRGRERLVLEDSRVGFHSPFETGLFGTVYQGDSGDQRAEYLAAGLTRDFVDAALKVKPDDVWYPPPARLIAAHVATAVVGRDRLPDSNLDGAATLDGARAAILRDFPVLDAFRVRSPDALDTVATWYLDAYRRERPESENGERLRAIVSSAVLVALSRADDATIVAAGRFLARGMAAATGDPEACLRIAAEADLLEAEAQLGRNDTAADTRARAIVAAAAAGHRGLHVGADGGPLAQLAADDRDADAAGCTAARAAYDALLRRPAPEAAATLRRLVDATALASLGELKTIAALRR